MELLIHRLFKGLSVKVGTHGRHAAGKRASYLRMLLSGPLRFLHCYIIRLGFLDGMAGLQLSTLTGLSSFIKQVRMWELEHARPQPDPEAIRQAQTPAATDRRAA